MKSGEIKLSEHFTYKKLFRFTFPSITMMIFLSIYCVVDGFFVANFAGKPEFAALNIVLPLLMTIWAVGLMIGTGGSALIAKTLGEGEPLKANNIFSMLTYAAILIGVVLGFIASLKLKNLVLFFGATPELADLCVKYGHIILWATPFCILQNVFQIFFVTAEKPKMGLYVIVAAGIINMILDYIFIVPFKMGLEGAALATAISQFAGGFFPLVYFARKNGSLLKLGRAEFRSRDLFKTITNGSSEFMSNVAASIVTIVYNYQLLKYVGTSGVVAFGVILYIMYIFYAVHIGYSMGSAPIFSYNLGAKNSYELKNMTSKSLKIIMILGILMFVSAEIFAKPLSRIFVGDNAELLDFTVRGLRIFAISFIFGGLNIFGSAFFTALNNGVVSAIISFMRTLVFEIAAVMLLPLLFGVYGIWASVIVAEIMAMTVAGFFFIKLKKRYGY